MKIINNKGHLKTLFNITLLLVFIIASGHNLMAQKKNNKPKSIYAKDNLIAWCIVPFDSKERGPEERAEMLNRLGITKLAYDWREEHVPSFDKEMETLKKNNIALQGFWFYSGADPANDPHLDTVIDLFKRHNIKTQLWTMFDGVPNLDQMSQEEKIRAVSKPAAYIAQRLEEVGCSLGLYNHGGWYGEPENQLAIIEHLNRPNIGIVYNFSHAEEQIHRFEEFYPKILPHLYAINITGLKGGFPAEVVPVGQGNIEEKKMVIIQNSSYDGPIGIINEDFADDAEVGLKMNMKGIQEILKNIKDRRGLQTYRK